MKKRLERGTKMDKPRHHHKPHHPHKPYKPYKPSPIVCQEGFTRYTVQRGDSIFLIARRLGVDDGLIIANNPQIEDPALIFVGQTICIPIPISFPCRVELFPLPSTPPTQRAEVLVEQLPNGQQQATIFARNLVPPTVFGEFDAYEGFIFFEGLGAFGFLLTEQEPGMWSGTLTVPRPIFYAGALVSVRPTNTQTGGSGPPILQNDLSRCARPIDIIPPKG